MKNYIEELNQMVLELNNSFTNKRNSLVEERTTTAHEEGKILNIMQYIAAFEIATKKAEYHPTTVSNFRKDCDIIKKDINAL